MTSERWRRIEEIYYAALERAASERASFVEAACGGDKTLRADVERLIAAQDKAGDFLVAPAWEVGASALVAATTKIDRPMSLVGRHIATYEILAPLGVGGMGEVYRSRDTTLNRDVAVRLPANPPSRPTGSRLTRGRSQTVSAVGSRPLTLRLAGALREHRHLRSARVLCQDNGQPLTRQMVQYRALRASRREVDGGRRTHPSSHVLLAPGDAWRAREGDPGARRARGPDDDAALHAPEPGGARQRDQAARATRGSGQIRTRRRRRDGRPERFWQYGGNGPADVKTINRTGQEIGGEAGIRTLGRSLSPYNGLANRRLQPLGHLTADA